MTSAHVQVFEGKPPRVLVAVVLDQDEAAVYWEAFEPTLRAQETGLLWDLLVIDVTAKAGPNYAAWLASLIHSWPRSRVRRLSAEHVRDGLVTTFSDHRFAIKAGMEAATELFGRWRSYDALWVLRPDAQLAPDALQAAWDGHGLLARDEVFQYCVCGHRPEEHADGKGACVHAGDRHACDAYVSLLDAEANRDETVLERSNETTAITAVAATLGAPAEADRMQRTQSDAPLAKSS